MNHWLECGKLKHLEKKYPVGCRIEVCWSYWGRTFGIVRDHEVFTILNKSKAYVVINTKICSHLCIKEENIVRILQEAGKDDK